MAQLPIDEAIVRFKDNEDKFDTFVNLDGTYTTNEVTPRAVQTLPSFMDEMVSRYYAYSIKGDWVTSTAYEVQDLVKESGTTYVCLVAHTSGIFATDLSAGKWGVYQGVTVDDLASSASGKGAGMVGYGDGLAYADGSVGGALNERLPEIGNYAALDAYTGDATAVLVYGVQNIFDGGNGVFRRTTDTPSAANGIYRQDALGRWWKRELSGEVFVTWFGANGSGDASTASANTVAINAAAQACAINAYDVGRGGPTLVFPEAIGYRVDGPITVPAGVPVDMRNTSILYGGATDITVLTIGEVSTRSLRVTHNGLDVRRDGTFPSANEADIGCRIINHFFCQIHMRGARYFHTGFQLNGVNPGEGCYANTIYIGYLFGNRYGLDLKGGDGTAAGWVNENVFIGGECQGGTATSYNRYGVRVRNTPAGSIYNDNNLFIRTTFELNGAPGDEAIPFLIEHSHALRAINVRQEGANATVVARILNNSRNTDLHVGHQQTTESAIDDQSIEKSTTLQSQKLNWSYHGREIFNSGCLGARTAKYNATRWHVPGLNFYRQVDTTIINNAGPLAAAPSGNKIQLSATDAVARMIDTSRCKKFVISIDADTAQMPWVVVQAFDAAGAILTSAGGGHPYVSGPGFAWASTWQGYAYASSVDVERLFTVGPDVKSVRVGIYNGYVRGFSIHAIGVNNQYAATYSGYEDVVPCANIGMQAPDAGTYLAGRIVWNAAPTAGAARGWRCNSPGTPGTWEAI